MAETKPRVLFVDDEVELLEGLRTSLRRQRRLWEMTFVADGESGLEELSKAEYDVIVSDMRMPRMDGATFLHHARQRHPGAIRLALTGHADDRLSMRAIPVTQQWLAKPCDRERLVGSIGQALAVRALVGDPQLLQAAGGIAALPSAPRLYTHILDITSDPDCALEDVTKVLERDPGMSARVLQLVNSAYFSLPRNVSHVADAVAFLGLETITQLVLAQEVFTCLEPADEVAGLEADGLQAHSVLTGRIGARIAAELDAVSPEDAFTAGILHDVGLLLFATTAPEELRRSLQRSIEEDRPLAEIERSEEGATHAEAGGYLLATWGLPVALVLAVAHHHEPGGLDDLDLTGVTHVASALATEIEVTQRGAGKASALDLDYLARVGVESRLPDWRALAADEAALGAEEGRP
ncbi:MAG: response regulator [Proteobacteria bacterium]|nr:response regulator [Pseudomonadota bacterium]